MDELAGAVVKRISVAESSTSLTDSVVEFPSGAAAVVIGFSVSVSIRISFGVEDNPIEGRIFITAVVVATSSTC